MARIHSKHKGRSGSTRPVREAAPDWQPLKPGEVETQVVSMAKEGKSTANIGLLLRDQFGVPDIRLATGKSVTQILKAKELQPALPEDIANLLKRVVNMQEHLPRHTKDLKNKRALALIEAKIRRLARYHKRAGNLPADWNYTSDTARLLLE